MLKNRNLHKHGFSFSNSISRWDEALALGNGGLGCLVYGNAAPLRFALDRVDIWDTTPNPATLKDDFTYGELVKLVRGGEANQSEILRRFDDIYFHPTPTKLPVGAIELDFPVSCDKISSTLSIANATASLSWGDVSVETYVHSLKQIGFIKVRGAKPVLRLVSPKYRDETYRAGTTDHELCFGNQLAALNYENAEHFQKGRLRWFVQSTRCDLVYAAAVCERETKDGVYIAYTIACSHDGENWLEEALESVAHAVTLNYTAEKHASIEDWHRYHNLSSVSLPDPVLEACWDRNNYFLNACSREGFYPMPLQGVWTADNGCLPPWKGDYHHDLNTQMSYLSYMKANRMANGKCFPDFLWDNRESGKRFAKRFYDADGLLYPTVCAIDGTPLGGWPQYSLNIVNNIWLCQAFDHYYLYSGDRGFLRERAYPYFSMVASAVRRWLKKDAGGTYRLPLSSSPEVYDNSFRAWQQPNTANDLALLRYLFETLLRYESELKLPGGGPWQEYLDGLGGLPLSEDGGIKMSAEEELPESHRHFGHLMAVYPLHQIGYETETDRRTVDASVARLEKLGEGLWCCFSYGWAAALYAVQENGNAAWRHLRTFTDYIVSPNGFNLNFDYKNYGVSSWHERPFTLESNFGFNDALQEMLLQNHAGYLSLFPAIPDHFREKGCSFTDFRTYGGFLVSAVWKRGGTDSCTLKGAAMRTVRVRHNFRTDTLMITDSSGEREISIAGKRIIELELAPGETVLKSTGA